MLEVKIPSEIRDYKSKVFMGLTVRQIISIAGSLAVGVPLGVFGGNFIPTDILMWAVIFAVVPIIAWGFAKFKGMRFEEAVKILFMYNFFPQRRVYEDADVNYFSHVKMTLNARDILRQRINNNEFDEDETELEEKDYAY